MSNTTPNSKSIGDAAEFKAVGFLRSKKVKIIDTNFHSKLGELDIVAQEESTLCFIEVKYRKNSFFRQPYEAVSKSKQKKIIRTAEFYLQKHPAFSKHPCRFDIISIVKDDITWIKNAFDTSS